MKKALLLLLGASTLAGSAIAQTNVSIYGLVDAGIVHERGGATDSVTLLGSGIAAGSRLGFRGVEDLGGGLAATFVLEMGFNIDTGVSGQGALFGRQAWVGLQQNGVGNVMLGRQYTPLFNTVNAIDPFGGASMAGSGNNMLAEGGIRMNNTVKVAAVGTGPLVAEVAYGFGETPGDSSANRNMGAMLGYKSGPVDVRFGYHRNNNADGTDDGRSAMIGGTYDFKVAKAHLGMQANKGLVIINGRPIADTDTRDLIIGATVPFGANSLLVSYTHKDDRSAADGDARQLALGISHRLSKRTDLYASVARIKNDAPVGSVRFYTVGNGSSQGTGDRAFNVGVRHLF
ncbi:porin [Noviherbaspirillum malthae]|uniref:porin n=1 Tax=Noviherbaspirillum malthae TaxID=1260987 RepID=UPI00188F29E3|nr:porin [Noviherbaspirillum malthae]